MQSFRSAAGHRPEFLKEVNNPVSEKKDKDQGPYLKKLALVLAAVRLLIELLK